MTRAEIVDAVGLGPEAGYGLMRLAALEGRICYGPDRGADSTFVSLNEWLPNPLRLAPPPSGLVARRYLAGYGPAEPEDLATWWGMPVGAARKELAALDPPAVEVRHGGRRLMAAADHPDRLPVRRAAPSVRLLPAWDAYLLGHRNRDIVVDRRHVRRVNRGGGWVHPVVLVDGRVAGVWRTDRQARRLRVTVERFVPISAAARAGLAEEADDVGRFLGIPADLSVAP